MKVYEAINKVQAALAKDGIGKNRKNQQQGYSFRGIDDVYNALAPMLAANGLCILPRMLSRSVEERINKNGTALFYVTVEAEFDLVAAEDGSKHTIRTYGEAMDSGDKATNKAMSAAYKYACMQAFAIPTEGDNDADASTHQVAAKVSAKSVTRDTFDNLSPEDQNILRDIAMEAKFFISRGDMASAVDYIEAQELNADLKSGLWSLFEPTERTAIKKHQQAARQLVTA